MIQSKQMHFLRIGRKQRGLKNSAFPLPSFLLLALLASVALMLSRDVTGALVMKLSIFPFVSQVRGVVFDFSGKKQRWDTSSNHCSPFIYPCCWQVGTKTVTPYSLHKALHHQSSLIGKADRIVVLRRSAMRKAFNLSLTLTAWEQILYSSQTQQLPRCTVLDTFLLLWTDSKTMLGQETENILQLRQHQCSVSFSHLQLDVAAQVV